MQPLDSIDAARFAASEAGKMQCRPNECHSTEPAAMGAACRYEPLCLGDSGSHLTVQLARPGGTGTPQAASV